MNPPESAAFSVGALPALQRLLLAYAPAPQREWQGLCWLLDQRLAAIARRGGDPTIAAIRLAWWDDVLVARDGGKGRGEPLVERWRAVAPPGVEAPVERLIDGWRALVSPDPMSEDDLSAYGAARGGGLFGLFAAGADPAQAEAAGHAGHLWALWDLAAHSSDEALAVRAIAAARPLADARGPAGAPLRPLRLARAVALADVRAGRMPRAGFSARHYGHLLLASLRG